MHDCQRSEIEAEGFNGSALVDPDSVVWTLCPDCQCRTIIAQSIALEITLRLDPKPNPPPRQLDDLRLMTIDGVLFADEPETFKLGGFVADFDREPIYRLHRCGDD